MKIEGLMNLLKNFLFWLKLFNKINFLLQAFFKDLVFECQIFDLGKNNS